MSLIKSTVSITDVISLMELEVTNTTVQVFGKLVDKKFISVLLDMKIDGHCKVPLNLTTKVYIDNTKKRCYGHTQNL